METLGPISTSALKRKISPRKKPAIPDSPRYIQARAGKFRGMIYPCLKKRKRLKKIMAQVILIILTGTGPILLDAASKNWTLIVQHNTVQTAINSPVIDIGFLY